ncbi:TIGR00341 family protein [Mollicutes bacterium LVI A0039]|nr:TIGR00341 family protein [Mollicutes bacterium LVI A0039]
MNENHFFSMRKGSASPQKVYGDMKANLVFNPPEAVILMCAIVIASVGLNVGSTAVVIGAMLISPIMGPIQTIGFSIATGNKDMLKKAFVLFFKQVIIAIVSSTIYFWISPLNQPSSEILARTSPTFWDVLIAIFGGLAGIIGVTRAEKTNVIPGVAIATALMPPLATVGFGIAQSNMIYALGALYLFAINATFIAIASVIGVSLIGMRKLDVEGFKSERKSRKQLYILLTILVIPSMITSILQIDKEIITGSLNELVAVEIETDTRKVVSTELDYLGEKITLIIVGDHISESHLSEIESSLPEYGLQDYSINIVQNSFKDSITSTVIQSISPDAKSEDDSEVASETKSGDTNE